MALRLTPRDDSFQRLFAALTDQISAATREATAALGTTPEELPALADRLRDIERAGDEATHAIIAAAADTFVTPLDREDLHALALALDNCINHLYAAVDLQRQFTLVPLPAGVTEQVDVLVRMAELTAASIPGLRASRKIADYWVEVNRLENVANDVHRGVIGRLLDDPTLKAKDCMKAQLVVDEFEAAANAFEAVAHVVQGIAIKGF